MAILKHAIPKDRAGERPLLERFAVHSDYQGEVRPNSKQAIGVGAAPASFGSKHYMDNLTPNSHFTQQVNSSKDSGQKRMGSDTVLNNIAGFSE